MIVCHVEGDGLGHLTRVRAYLHTLRPAGPVIYRTSSPFAADRRVVGPARVERDFPAGSVDEFVVDAFPAGRHGELTAADAPPAARTVHLARLLRWDVYRERLPADPPRFDRTYVLEDLHPDHLAYLRSVSAELRPLTLVDPPAAPPAEPVTGWLIVHSGPDSELLHLVDYARETAAMEGVRPPMTLVAPRRPDGLPAGIAYRDDYPAAPLAASADRVVTAAGFNAVRQFAPLRERHRMLPFPRALDDQFARAARARQPRSRGSTSVE
ncbi:hypothetical protein [Actinomadura atramentaria]|uniref:hypothetical protein n=1 Tax=Actinomadura atramentaria TaxID=1990 RepID=UPI00035E65D3|nr:hypothetical protein [Actinomadura atramentaria]